MNPQQPNGDCDIEQTEVEDSDPRQLTFPFDTVMTCTVQTEIE